MIITKLKGGMGNQMFQYALGRALSIKNNTDLGLDLKYLLDRTPRPNFTFRNYDLDIFNIEAEVVPNSKILLKNKTFNGMFGIYIDYIRRKFFKIKGIEKSYNFDSNILNLKDGVYLDGYWQSPKYFSEIEDIIRKDFTLKNIPNKDIIDLSNKIKNENSLCVYIRRRDYLKDKNFNIIDDEYRNRALDYISKLSEISMVYVFSDDIEWCKQNIKFRFQTMFVDSKYEGDRFVGYLYLMSFCKYFIIANSTFSWWGAWLSMREGKVVIAPKKWNADDSINTDEIIPKEWMRL